MRHPQTQLGPERCLEIEKNLGRRHRMGTDMHRNEHCESRERHAEKDGQRMHPLFAHRPTTRPVVVIDRQRGQDVGAEDGAAGRTR